MPSMANEARMDDSFSAVYRVLRRLASRQVRQRGATLDTTALVHEAWLKLEGGAGAFESRGHYLAVAATAMRQIVVDHARKRLAGKRGGAAPVTASISRVVDGSTPKLDELLAIDAALGKLEALDPRLARVVELRFFAGLEEAEIASALSVDVRTVRRDWRKARAFILAELGAE
jgi:RNA polymerase sigma factor (TIGR02999 family)